LEIGAKSCYKPEGVGERYRYLLRIPFDLRDKLAGAAARDGCSFNAEVQHRLEESFERGAAGAGRGALFRRIVIRVQGREACTAPS
jgi:hypothetical protein